MSLLTPPDLSEMLGLPPYGLAAADKHRLMVDGLRQLTAYHRQQCAPYARVLEVLGAHEDRGERVEDIPFLPVRVFKAHELLSIPREQVFKTMTSSGTSGQQVSRIYLDRETAQLQNKVLARLMGDVLGKSRLPMLIVDSPAVLRDRHAFSARGAGILGFSLFGQDVTYALDEGMNLDLPAIQAFLARHEGQRVFVFGFTFMVWQHFLQALEAQDLYLSLPGGVLLHGGGWKKLQDQAVDSAEFNRRLMARTGLDRVVNYYGMVEQTGSIHMACEAGHLHTSIWSDIVVRDHRDFSALPVGQPGLVEVLSLLPRSYPGHALLTEDVGTLLGEDDCPCGRLGRYFSISGRVAQAEVRGCSDAYAAQP